AAYPDLSALADAVADGEPAPDAVLVVVGRGPEPVAADDTVLVDDTVPADDPVVSARRVTAQALALLKEWLGLSGADAARLAATRLVIVTAGAAAVVPGDPVTDLAAAA